jgi:hypothetical protein
MKLVKKFDSYVKKGNAVADLKNFKFKFEKTGYERGYQVTWCPDANIRNVLIGGDSSGTATYHEFITARAMYESSCIAVSYSMVQEAGLSSDDTRYISFTDSDTLDAEPLLNHLVQSTATIISRIWSCETIEKNLRADMAEHGHLSKQIIRAFFGVKRRQQVTLFQLNLPIDRRIALLNECIKICNVNKKWANNQRNVIDSAVAIRAYKRIVSDPCGVHRVHDIDLLQRETQYFPEALEHAININGYIDEWAKNVNFDSTLPPEESTIHSVAQDSQHRGPTVHIQKLTYAHRHTQKSFWFMTINEAFSDSFWKEWISAIDDMRFCFGLSAKSNAFAHLAKKGLFLPLVIKMYTMHYQ